MSFYNKISVDIQNLPYKKRKTIEKQKLYKGFIKIKPKGLLTAFVYLDDKNPWPV